MVVLWWFCGVLRVSSGVLMVVQWLFSGMKKSGVMVCLNCVFWGSKMMLTLSLFNIAMENCTFTDDL